MWGCTRIAVQGVPDAGVFPTHVGVYLTLEEILADNRRFPHACGGVPPSSKVEQMFYKFSPRMWGCTESHHRGKRRSQSFPHACGGVPSKL